VGAGRVGAVDGDPEGSGPGLGELSGEQYGETIGQRGPGERFRPGQDRPSAAATDGVPAGSRGAGVGTAASMTPTGR
jgi:hypothetical protein